MAGSSDDLVAGSDGAKRCFWCIADPLYVQYHDTEWGRPSKDETLIFEQLCLEGFQAGLSWFTILKKREAFRKGFGQFDYQKIAKYNEKKIEALLQNEGIVRHRAKIESTINNAKRAIELVDGFGSLAKFVWQYAPEKSKKMGSRGDIVASTNESLAMSKELRKRGWSFLGPTTCYAFMQSVGIVNDHFGDCEFYTRAERERKAFLKSL